MDFHTQVHVPLLYYGIRANRSIVNRLWFTFVYKKIYQKLMKLDKTRCVLTPQMPPQVAKISDA